MIIKNTVPDYSPSALACFALFTGGNALTETEKRALSIFIDSQVESGNWRQIHTMKMGRRLSSEAKCLIDLKGVRNSTGTGSWDIATGVQTNGTSTFWNLGFIESSDAVNQDGSSTLNNIGTAIELVSNDHGGATGDLLGVVGSVSARQTRYAQVTGGVNRTWKNHSSSTITSALGPFTNKWHTIFRTLSNRQGLDVEMDALTTDTTASSNIPDRTMYAGANNNNGTAASFFAGKFGTFIAYNYVQFDHPNFYVNWQFMMQMLGDTKDDLYPYDNVVQYYTRNDAVIIKMDGQSNCSGRSNGRAAKYAVPLNADVVWTTANPPVTGTPTVIQRLEFGKNHSFDSLSESGYELPLCYTLSSKINARIVLDKYSKAGTDLKGVNFPGISPGTWKVSLADMANLSENVLSVRGWQIIDDSYLIKKCFLIWDQHEADINGTDTATYNTELSLLIKYMIDQHEAAGYNFATTTEFHVIIRKAWTGLSGTTLADIIAAQNGQEAHFNSTHPTYTAKVRSWKLFSSENLAFPDGVHLSTRSYEIIGLRLGAWLSRR